MLKILVVIYYLRICKFYFIFANKATFFLHQELVLAVYERWS